MTPALLSILMLLRMVSGLLVWASAFVLLYAGHSLACQWYAPVTVSMLGNPVTVLLIVLAFAHGAALAALAIRWRRHPPPMAQGEPPTTHRFRYRTEGLLLLVSFAGLIWITLPLLLTYPCLG